MIPNSACRNPAAWRSGRWERSRRVSAVSMARSEYRRGERGPGDRPASSPRGAASYTWDELSTASRSCDSCGGEKDGPNRPTHRRSFMQQRRAPPSWCRRRVRPTCLDTARGRARVIARSWRSRREDGEAGSRPRAIMGRPAWSTRSSGTSRSSETAFERAVPQGGGLRSSSRATS